MSIILLQKIIKETKEYNKIETFQYIFLKQCQLCWQQTMFRFEFRFESIKVWCVVSQEQVVRIFVPLEIVEGNDPEITACASQCITGPGKINVELCTQRSSTSENNRNKSLSQ